MPLLFLRTLIVSAESNDAKRETQSLRTSLDHVQRLYEEERHKSIRSIKVLEEEFQREVRSKEEEYRRRCELQESNKDLRIQLDTTRTQVMYAPNFCYIFH